MFFKAGKELSLWNTCATGIALAYLAQANESVSLFKIFDALKQVFHFDEKVDKNGTTTILS